MKSEDLNAYYSNLSKYDGLASVKEISEHDRERAALAARFIAPLVPSIGSVLDVGCAAGVLLKALRDAGIEDVRGIDPAAKAPEVANKLFAIPVSISQAEDFEGYGTFDLICLMAVLEHLRDPRQLLGKIAQQLKAHARLLIEVPDAGAFDRPDVSTGFEPFGEFSNEHINFFAIGDIRRLAHDVGFEVERWQSFRTSGGSPGLFAVLHRAPATPQLIGPEADSTATRESCADALPRYVNRSMLFLEDVETRLADVGRNEVLIYGAGNHTCRLMVCSAALSHCSIRAIFDRNTRLHGFELGGFKIRPPARIQDYSGLPIIVSTFNASREIHTTLRRATTQPVIALYG